MMKTTEESDRYKKILGLMRSSRPDLARPEEIVNEVIKRIQHGNRPTDRISDFIGNLFGWIYIGWVRNSLVAAAAVMVSLFIYQQALILKQVNNISRQQVVTGIEPIPGSMTGFDNKLTIYKFSNKLSPSGDIKISEKQLEMILESYDNLRSKYKNLIRIIEEDPELKRYIEGKLDANKKYKPDI
jgi:hypothetical protein